MCESVPVAQTVGEEQGPLRPNKQRRKRKQTLETWPWTEPCWSWSWAAPRAPLGLQWPPEVTEWSLTPQQPFIKGRQAGRRRLGKLLWQADEATNHNVVQCRGPVHWPVAVPWADFMSASHLDDSVKCQISASLLTYFPVRGLNLQWCEGGKGYELGR